MESFGRFLRAEREARGVSIEDLAQVTKISRQVLIDLEADHFESLPAPVFLKGFVRTIARTLALPQQDVMERFDEFLKTHGPGAGLSGEGSSGALSKGGTGGSGPTPAPRESWGPMPFVLGVVALLVAIVIAYQVGSDEPPTVTKYANQPEAAEVAAPVETEPAETEEPETPAEESLDEATKPVTPDAKEPEDEVASAEAAVAEPETPPEPGQAAPAPRNQWIVLKARKEIWIRAAEDDLEPRNFKLDAGEQIRQRFAKKLEIRVGDPSRLSVVTPEGTFKTLGGATKPRTWNFPLSEEAKAELTALSESFVEPEVPVTEPATPDAPSEPAAEEPPAE